MEIFFIIFGFLCILSVIYFLIPMFYADKFDKKVFQHRCDDPEHPCYVHFEDYPDMSRTPYECSYSSRSKIRGYIYQNKERKEFKGFVILSHGMFGTHVQYLVDVAYLTREGYQVLCYDQYGVGLSDGKRQISLAHGIKVLHVVIKDVEKNNLNHDLKITLYGHSWGAYCSLGVLDKHPEIEKAVCRSGPIGPLRAGMNLVAFNNPKFYKIFRFALPLCFYIVMGKENVVSSTSRFKKNPHTKVFITYSKNDPMVNMKNSQYYYFSKHPNKQVQIQLTSHGLHNNIITEESYASFINKTKEYFEIEKMEDPLKKAQARKRFLSNLDRANMVIYQVEVKDSILDFMKD